MGVPVVPLVKMTSFGSAPGLGGGERWITVGNQRLEAIGDRHVAPRSYATEPNIKAGNRTGVLRVMHEQFNAFTSDNLTELGVAEIGIEQHHSRTALGGGE